MADSEKLNPVEAMASIVSVLGPHSSEERGRIVRAALTLLGDRDETSTPSAQPADQGDAGTLGDFSPRVRSWINQAGLSSVQLEQVFHVSGGEIEVIAAIPGKSKKEQTANAYVLTGLGQFLLTGQASFPDRLARSLCEISGCYDYTNHSTYLKNMGNAIAGSKDKGWTLTAPGLKRAADLVKELCKTPAT